MYIGTQDVDPRGRTNLTDIEGVAFVTHPPRLELSPSEPAQMQFAGFGPVGIIDGTANGELHMSTGTADLGIVAVSSERVVFALADATIEGKKVDVSRTGLLLAGGIPLEMIESVSVIARKTLTGKRKPTRVAFTSQVFFAALEPAAEISGSGAQKAKDPWPLAQQLVDIVLTSRGYGDAERSRQLQQGWLLDESGNYDFVFTAIGAASAHSPKTSSEERPPKQDVDTILPVYFAVDSEALARDAGIATSLQDVWSHFAAADEADATVRFALVSFGAEANVDAPLDRPSSGTPLSSMPPGPPSHHELFDYLPQLIDHDMSWFKSEGIQTLRPLLVVVSSSPEPFPDARSSKLTSADWRFRPNLVVVGTTVGSSASSRAVDVQFSAHPLSEGQTLSGAFTVIADAITDAAHALAAGNSPGLRFPDSLPGFTIRPSLVGSHAPEQPEPS